MGNPNQQLLQAIKEKSAVMKQTYEVETITPLLMHGNTSSKRDSRLKEAELRESSLKGIYRYWWRALQYEATNPKKLLEKEGQLFGAATGANVQKSAVLLRVSERLMTGEVNTMSRPHANNARKDVIGLINKTFAIDICCFQKDKAHFEELAAYFELTLLLGSFGQRARRGAGALQLVNREYSTIKDYELHVSDCLQRIGKLNRFEQPSSTTTLFTIKKQQHTDHPTLRNIWIGRAFSSAEETRTAISNAGHLYNGTEIAKQGGKQLLGKIKGGRQASPIIVTVRKIGNKYYPVISEIATKQIVTASYETVRDKFLKELGVER